MRYKDRRVSGNTVSPTPELKAVFNIFEIHEILIVK